MGSSLSGLLGRIGGEGGPPDPVTGLTPAEVESIRRSFVSMRADPKEFGIELFLSLFDAHPEYQKKFISFSQVPRDQLRGNKHFEANATVVAYTVVGLIDNLHDSGCLVELLLRVGRSHGRRGIQPEAFENIKIVILNMLKSKLGRSLTPFAESSWSKMLEVSNSVIFKGLEETKIGDTNTSQESK